MASRKQQETPIQPVATYSPQLIEAWNRYAKEQTLSTKETNQHFAIFVKAFTAGEESGKNTITNKRLLVEFTKTALAALLNSDEMITLMSNDKSDIISTISAQAVNIAKQAIRNINQTKEL